jgi:phytoene desaturase
MERKKVIIVGAGPGGLTAAMILAHKGFDVTVFEKNAKPGGRNGCLEVEGYKFDIGPTFLMMKFVLDDLFKQVGRNVDEYVPSTRLAPMYRLLFDEVSLDVYDHLHHDKMKEQMAKLFPDDVAGLDRFMKREQSRFDKILGCLTSPYDTLGSMVGGKILKALPFMSLGKSLFQVLGEYFPSQRARVAFTFQAKYLGMAPWRCPGFYAMIPFVEHRYGIFHTRGGLSEISVAMAKVATEMGATFRYRTPVERLLLDGRKVTGVMLADGSEHRADAVVVNADFGYAATKLVPPGTLKRWSAKALAKKRFSLSTYMLYLGVKKTYDLPHHTIVFAKDYIKNINDIEAGVWPEGNASFYVRNASSTDPTLAPPGCSALYLLMPAPNKRARLDWPAMQPHLRRYCLDQMKSRLGMTDIEENIVVERCFTPDNWQDNFNVYIGATFNLGHNLGQMLYWRPHNDFEELDNMYLVGGGTHPGSGLPTIYESGRISAGMICERYGLEGIPPAPKEAG